MKDRIVTVAAVIAICFLLLRNQETTATPVRKPTPQWEQLALNIPGDKLSTPEISRKIIGLGNDGWQLIDVETTVKGGDTTAIIYFFQRQK
ncbi:hypothetical protein OAH18_00820 [bacterium]|nr:hypothetical protein [bacterium]